MYTGKIQISEKPPNVVGFIVITDIETDGQYFYEEFCNKDHARQIAREHNSHDGLVEAAKIGLAYVKAIITKVPRPIQDLESDKKEIEAALAEAEKEG